MNEIERNNLGQFLKGGNGNRRTHGLSGTQIQKVFYGMRRRCENPTDTHYKWYGGKGVKVIWASFEDFRADMYDSWVAHVEKHGKERTQIDRIDRNGDYCKENCRWVTPSQQQRNRSSNVLLTFNGQTKTAVEWGEETGITGQQITKRLRRGWPLNEALTFPKGKVGTLKRKYHLHESIK